MSIWRPVEDALSEAEHAIHRAANHISLHAARARAIGLIDGYYYCGALSDYARDALQNHVRCAATGRTAQLELEEQAREEGLA